MSKVYVVTNPELGWDCVVGVFLDLDYVNEHYGDEDHYVIHNETISTKKSTTINNSLTKYGRTNTVYPITDYNVCEEMFLVMDSLKVTVGDYYKKNNKETISLIIDVFICYCKENNIKYENVYLCCYDNRKKDFLAFADGLSEVDMETINGYGAEGSSFYEYLDLKKIESC